MIQLAGGGGWSIIKFRFKIIRERETANDKIIKSEKERLQNPDREGCDPAFDAQMPNSKSYGPRRQLPNSQTELLIVPRFKVT